MGAAPGGAGRGALRLPRGCAVCLRFWSPLPLSCHTDLPCSAGVRTSPPPRLTVPQQAAWGRGRARGCAAGLGAGARGCTAGLGAGTGAAF